MTLSKLDNVIQNAKNALNIAFVTKPEILFALNLYKTVFSVERDHHDASAKTRESQDCSLKVLELQKRLDQARAQVS